MREKQTLLSQVKTQLVSQAITATIAACVTLVSAYFLLLSQGSRILALEQSSVRQDVLNETIGGIKSDISDIKATQSRIETKLDRYIAR